MLLRLLVANTKTFAALSPGSSARAVPAGVAAFHFNQLEGLGLDKKNSFIYKENIYYLKNVHLSSVEYKYYPLFSQRTGQSIVDGMLNYDPVLKANYEHYQELMEYMANKDFEALSSCLTNAVPSAISNYMRTSLNRLDSLLSIFM